MMPMLIELIALLPLLAALMIGGLHFSGHIDGESGEKTTARIAVGAISISAAFAIAAWLNDCFGYPVDPVWLGSWLQSGAITIDFSFSTARLNLGMAAVFGLLLMIVTRFAVNYLHREPGFHRFFFVLSLFSAAMLVLVLSANALLTFAGWELAGLCSYLLIGYAYDRPVAADNALRVFVTNRIGDSGFLLALALSAYWVESLDWIDIVRADLFSTDVTWLSLCFVLAACVKSAQVPFTPWLARAMEGPTPSSAIFYGGVMVHAGVFLLIQLQDLLQQAPLVMLLLIGIGGLTTLYSAWVGLSQTDIKSSQVFATTAQIGLMFVECGLGWWQLATLHLCAHAVVRCYLLLVSPSIMHNALHNPIKPVSPVLVNCRWAFMASLQRGWLEAAGDWLLVRPLQLLARDLHYFDNQVVDPLLGSPLPVIRAASSLAQREEGKVGANLDSDVDSFAQGSGLAGKLAGWTASLLDWFEYHFILRGIGRDSIRFGRRLGHLANRFEKLLSRPRYVALFVLITLLVALGQ